MLIASAIPLYAAYGDRAIGDNANPLSKKNLILTGSLAAWLFADDLVNRFARDSKAWRSVANAWSYLAPFGNAATVYYLMKDKQHERFVTGTAKSTNASVAPVDLLPLIGKDYHADFNGIKPPLAVASIASVTTNTGVPATETPPTGVRAWVNTTTAERKLRLDLVGAGKDWAGIAEIAWAVNTMRPEDQRKSSATSS